jgi:predicted Zn finger-like uncharacterized protein
MRIICPSCAADYEVPASRLTPHKMVRCARCGGQWVPDHPAENSASPEVTAAAPSGLPAETIPPVSAMDRLAAPLASRRPPAGLLVAWVLTFVVLAGGLGATVIWREKIMRAWPPSALFLAPFGHAAPQPAQTAGKKTE